MRFIVRAVLLAVLTLQSSVAFSRQNVEALIDGTVDEKVSNISLANFDVEQNEQSSVATFEYSHPGSHKPSRYLRLVINELILGDGDKFVIEGTDLSSLGNVNGQTLMGPMKLEKPLTTDLVYGSWMRISLISKQIQSAKVNIKNFVYQDDAADPQLSIYDTDDRLNFTSVGNPTLSATGRAVIFISYLDGESSRVCSGFVINSDEIMTNEHCVNSFAKCQTASIVFDYLQTNGVITMGEQRRCSEVIVSDRVLDYSVLKLDQPVPQIAPIAFAKTDVPVGVPTFLIQHPGGEHKQLAEVGCQVIDPKEPGLDPQQLSDVTHRCDTIGGASGSPIVTPTLDGQHFCVAALHHLGFDDEGKFVTKNRAVKISLIAEQLKERSIEYTTCTQ
ncbi:trypsin-like serine peptidase [Rhizobium sp. ZW T2_16]|uniref:trypsin-like serine peptidase n=1 Tax=Rhizobium sp. ZW T2_16 TaxID=3378083 RepID=UPI0038537D23